MATALSALRAKLNGEIGVDDDTETLPWTATVRNTAISDGYAALWRAGVWKALTQSITVTDNTWRYALTAIRQISRVEVLDSAGLVVDQSGFRAEDSGAGGYELLIPASLTAGYTMTVRGWGPYTSTFANDAAVDDLPAEDNRVPLLKAKAILFRQQLARFARYSERENNPPELNVTADVLLNMIRAAEQEFELEAKRIRDRRPRVMQSSRALLTPR